MNKLMIKTNITAYKSILCYDELIFRDFGGIVRATGSGFWIPISSVRDLWPILIILIR